LVVTGQVPPRLFVPVGTSAPVSAAALSPVPVLTDDQIANDPGPWDQRVSTIGRAGTATMRRLSRWLGAYVPQPVPMGSWLGPGRGPGTVLEQGFVTSLGGIAPDGWNAIVVGFPGAEVPDFVLDQLREMLAGLTPAQWARTRLVFPGWLTADQLGWVRRRVVKCPGVEIVLTVGDVQPGPGGLVSSRPWQAFWGVAAAPTAAVPNPPVTARQVELGVVYPPAGWEQAVDGLVLPPGVRRIPAGLWLVPSGVHPTAAQVAAMRGLRADPQRLTLVVDGWDDVLGLTRLLRPLLAGLPPAVRASVRVAVPNAGPSAGVALEVALRLQVQVVAPVGAWAPGVDGRGYQLDPLGNAVWVEPGWGAYNPSAAPRLPLDSKLAGIFANAVQVPGGVLFDPADVNLVALANAWAGDDELFKVAIGVAPDGVHFRVGNQLLTWDEVGLLVWALSYWGERPVALVTDRPVERDVAHPQRKVAWHDGG
jgi:hypothetical protein